MQRDAAVTVLRPMSSAHRHPWPLRALLLTVALAAAQLGTNLTTPPTARADLQGAISAGRSAAATFQSQIATDTAHIAATTSGLRNAQRHLAAIQTELSTREAQLRAVQTSLLAARQRLVVLENRLHAATRALAANLIAGYEGSQPSVVTVVLEARGFGDLLERMSFMRRIAQRDAQIVGATRTARSAVSREATALEGLEQRDRTLTNQVLTQRNQAAALQAALLGRQIQLLGVRAGTASKLQSLNARLKTLEAQAAAQAAQAARAAQAAQAANASSAGSPSASSSGSPSASSGGSPSPSVGGIAIDTGGMVQAPPGAPAAVAQVIAAGNAIATLPYVYGGGHASFHDSAYDCSGSVSYALAAAGLVTSPLDSTGFESWGDAGPGRWITVYANAGHAFMIVAGWRFDTVALANGGTRWSSDLSGEDTSAFVARHPPGL